MSENKTPWPYIATYILNEHLHYITFAVRSIDDRCMSSRMHLLVVVHFSIGRHHFFSGSREGSGIETLTFVYTKVYLQSTFILAFFITDSTGSANIIFKVSSWRVLGSLVRG